MMQQSMSDSHQATKEQPIGSESLNKASHYVVNVGILSKKGIQSKTFDPNDYAEARYGLPYIMCVVHTFQQTCRVDLSYSYHNSCSGVLVCKVWPMKRAPPLTCAEYVVM